MRALVVIRIDGGAVMVILMMIRVVVMMQCIWCYGLYREKIAMIIKVSYK